MTLKLLALAGIMTATMGLTACDSKQENAQEDVVDAQEDVVDAQEDLTEAQQEAALADTQTTVTTTEMDTEVPMDGTAVDGTATDMDIATDTEAANAADGTDVVVVEEPVAQ